MEPGDKTLLRAEARLVRRAIDPAERAARSERIVERVLSLPEVRDARAVGAYASAGSEVETTLLLRGLLAKGVRVAVPLVEGDDLRFVRLQHPWALVPGPRGVPVPRQPWEDVEGSTLDVAVVPGLRFGRDGSRLGQGGGHFDRFLEAHPGPRRVALAFAAQVVDALETEPHDQGMDVLVTEDEVLRVPRPSSP
jgi:5-formyltetrahydrofolate cyclo-ligase